MDRARRAEPYSNATIWTREIARNLAGHLARISKAHSCVDTKSPKTRLLPKFQHGSHPQKRCATSPVKARHPHPASEHQFVNQGDGSEPEQRDDGEHGNAGQVTGDIDLQRSYTARNGDDSERTELKPVRQHRKLSVKKKVRNPSKKSRMEADRLEMIALENQRLQERLSKITTPTGKPQQQLQSRAGSAHHPHAQQSSSDDSMWDSLEKPQSKTPHEYNKKQEQLKIWNENQALVKRLRTAKPTLNCKEWEKDDKWNQHFLKSQEKRRIALQHELAKAQMSPLAIVRVAKMNQLESSPGTRSPSSAAIVSMGADSSSCRHEFVDEDTKSSATAANHRRIMMLRKQRSAPSKDQRHMHHVTTNQVGNNQFDVGSSASAEGNCESDVVDVRFTFSRERRCNPAADSSDSLIIEAASCFGGRHQNDNIFELGAFSPAVELESTLDAMGMDQVEPEDSVVEDGSAAGGGGTQDPEETLVVPESLLEQGGAFTDEEINAVVFDTLQDSIDFVADAFSDQLDGEQSVCKEIAGQQGPAQSVAVHETTQALPAPPPGAEATSDIPETVSSDAADETSSFESVPIPTVISGDGNEVPEDVNASSRVQVEFDRIPYGEEVEQELDYEAVGATDPEREFKAAAADPEPENRGGAEDYEPEYDEENFDDDAQVPETTELVFPDAAQLDPVEDLRTAAEADDEASGYGSEFDEDQDHHHEQQHDDHQQPEVSVEKESIAGGDDADVYDEHYDDDEVSDFSHEVTHVEHEQTKESEQAFSYSDDGFSDGDDT